MTKQEALPEGRWLWRRAYVFGTSSGAWIILERLVMRLPPEAALQTAQGLMSLLALTMVLYLVAPTAQQLVWGLGAILRGGRS